MEVGESILPPSSFGSVGRFNANGKYIRHRDRPMETAYTTVEWHWKEWHGPYREERSKSVDRPYKRYPRTFVPPPSIEITILNTTKGESIIVSPSIEYVKEKASLLKRLPRGKKPLWEVKRGLFLLHGIIRNVKVQRRKKRD